MDFELLMKAAELGMKFWEVIGPSAIVDALSAFGDTEHAAAAEALRTISIARRPESSIQQAIGHLQSACMAYRSAIEKIATGTKYYMGMLDIQERTQRATLDYCLIAVCQKMIGEPELMQVALDHAAELIAANPFDTKISQIRQAKGHVLGNALVATNMLSSLVQFRRFKRLQEQQISKAQFDSFCQTVRSQLAKPRRHSRSHQGE